MVWKNKSKQNKTLGFHASCLSENQCDWQWRKILKRRKRNHRPQARFVSTLEYRWSLLLWHVVALERAVFVFIAFTCQAKTNQIQLLHLAVAALRLLPHRSQSLWRLTVAHGPRLSSTGLQLSPSHPCNENQPMTNHAALFGPSLPLFLSLVLIGVLLSPGF